MSQSWYVKHRGKTFGPTSSSQLKKFVDSGKITRETHIRMGPDGEWIPASNVKGLFQVQEIMVPTEAHVVSNTAPSVPTHHQKPESHRNCPFCSESILITAIKCKHCSEFLDGRLREVPQSFPSEPSVQQVVHVTQVVPEGYQAAPKSKTTAILLALFFGGLGAHHFYTGRPFIGILYLLFFWTFIPAIIAFFEAIYYAFMSEKNFQRHCR